MTAHRALPRAAVPTAPAAPTPSIYEVARRAEVSVATVSRVLNGKGPVRAETRERVLLKQQPVLGGYDPAAYATERTWATATDGTRVPLSLVFRRDRPRDQRAAAGAGSGREPIAGAGRDHAEPSGATGVCRDS